MSTVRILMLEDSPLDCDLETACLEKGGIECEVSGKAGHRAVIGAGTDHVLQKNDGSISFSREPPGHRIAGINHEEQVKGQILVTIEAGDGSNRAAVLIEGEVFLFQPGNRAPILGREREVKVYLLDGLPKGHLCSGRSQVRRNRGNAIAGECGARQDTKGKSNGYNAFQHRRHLVESIPQLGV